MVEAACCQAISQGTIQSEVIINLIARAANPPPIEPITLAENLLRLREEPIADCGRYDSLRKGGGLCSGMN